MPIPGNPLGHVWCYAIGSSDGLLLLDPGWDSPESLSALQDALTRLGTGLQDVVGVLVTHIHADHYGLAGRIRELSGAWIALHPADADLLEARYDDPGVLLDEVETWLRQLGAPPSDIEGLRSSSMEVREFVRTALPDKLIEDRETIPVEGSELVAVHTPGHTPGHLCFVDPRRRLAFTGDHVLPRISPNVARHPQSTEYPLDDFLASLAAMLPYSDFLALPGHEWRFHGLGARILELEEHHAKRLDEVQGLLLAGAQTAWEVTVELSWSRPWSETEGFMRRAALGEAHAHLVTLERAGQARAEDGFPIRWRPPPHMLPQAVATRDP